MVKSVIDTSQSIHQQLMKVGELVDMFDKRDYDAIEAWLLWLKESEILLKTHNYTETSLLAGLRATIIKEKKNVDTAERNKRKNVIYQAVSTVDAAQQILFDINNKLVEKINGVRTLIKQILIPAKEAGLIKTPKEEGFLKNLFTKNKDNVDFTAYLETLLQQFKQNQQLAPSINNAIILIGKFDVLRIMAEEIDFL